MQRRCSCSNMFMARNGLHVMGFTLSDSDSFDFDLDSLSGYSCSYSACDCDCSSIKPIALPIRRAHLAKQPPPRQLSSFMCSTWLWRCKWKLN